jgi:predicted nicotinamide N-methyase
LTTPTYETTVQFVAIAGTDRLTVRSLIDRQQFYDPTGAAARLGICSASWPLFGMVWPSGIQLAAQLAQRPVCTQERILEIGCGLGIASLVAHRRGAHITASDRHPLTRGFLNENARVNGLVPLKYRHGQWGSHERPDIADTGADDLLTGRYDLIVGSDLLYDRDAPPAVARFIDDHAQPECEVWTPVSL